MIDVGSKPITRRVAKAAGEIQLSLEVCRTIHERKVPKGDVLVLAEVAGICAAKRTSDILPLCHPIGLDSVQVQCELDLSANRVLVSCMVTTHGRTGVEMEAMLGASGALLCIYDLTKGLDKGASISGIRLEYKEGGKSGRWTRDNAESGVQSKLQGLRSAVMTVSDRSSRGEQQDESGPILADFLRKSGAEIVAAKIVPDETVQIQQLLNDLTVKEKLDLVLITGGTGIGPRDLTPEALEPLWTRLLPGFGELFRSRGALSTPNAWLSRTTAGVIGTTLVVLLPGNPTAVRDGISILDEALAHAIQTIRGGGHS